MKRAALVLALLLVACGRNNPTKPTAPTNVLLITIDTLRADRVGHGLTPNIDALAATATRFTNARTVVPLTLPSHTVIMTGVLPAVSGVRLNGVAPADPRRKTLARVLRDAGYRTGAFVGA